MGRSGFATSTISPSTIATCNSASTRRSLCRGRSSASRIASTSSSRCTGRIRSAAVISSDLASLAVFLGRGSSADRVAIEHEGHGLTFRALADAVESAAGALGDAEGTVAVYDPDPIAVVVAALGAIAAARPALLVDGRHPEALARETMDRV